jgi:diguanylate cyclase (GGDEF)-like protein
MRLQTKEQTSQDILPPALGQGWEVFLPQPDHENRKVGDFSGAGLNDTNAALRQAEIVIRAQEERIRHLEEMAVTDELTGLANRRGFSAAFERELALARRDADYGGILVMLDLDGFKGVNDQWGHQTGDAYLCAVAQVLGESLRSSDIAARLGGDEFALLLTHMDEISGAKRLAKLEQSFGRRALILRDRIPLRASFGFAPYTCGDSAEAVMQIADLKLYAHKARNKKFTSAA